MLRRQARVDHPMRPTGAVRSHRSRAYARPASVFPTPAAPYQSPIRWECRQSSHISTQRRYADLCTHAFRDLHTSPHPCRSSSTRSMHTPAGRSSPTIRDARLFPLTHRDPSSDVRELRCLRGGTDVVSVPSLPESRSGVGDRPDSLLSFTERFTTASRSTLSPRSPLLFAAACCDHFFETHPLP
jgi:hypothetical protein